MNRGRISTQVFLCFLVMMFLMVIGCSVKDDIEDALPIHKITGTVYDSSNNGVSGVTVKLTGDESKSTTTNNDGKYEFDNLKNGNYTVKPDGYGSKTVTINNNDNVVNFTPVALPFNGTASGTWSWNSGTSTLTMAWTSSNFPCNGPSLGTQTMPNPTIAATTMIMGDMTWTRSPAGPVGDARGTWTATDSGNTYTLVISGDTSGTMSLTATIVSCGGNGENPYAQSQHWSGGYSVSLAYDDSPKTATSVSVTGHGITGSKVLTYNTGDGSWNSWTSPSTQVDFGTTYPTGLPFTYTFSITDPTTRTATSTVSCFQERFATNLSPTGTVTGTPTFGWTGIGDSSATYGVEVNDSSGNRIWQSNKISGTSIVYGGTALTAGATYNYNVLVTSSSACSNQSSFAQGSFTHQ